MNRGGALGERRLGAAIVLCALAAGCTGYEGYAALVHGGSEELAAVRRGPSGGWPRASVRLLLAVEDGRLTGHGVRRRIESALEGIDANETLSSEERRRSREALLDAELSIVVEEALVLEAARRRSIQVEDEAVRDRVEEMADEAGGYDALLEILRSEGRSLAELVESIRLETTRLLLSAEPHLSASEFVIRNFYLANPQAFMTGPWIAIEEIVLDVSALGGREAAWSRAQEIRGELEKGADFAATASRHSSPRAAGAGHLLRWAYTPPGQLAVIGPGGIAPRRVAELARGLADGEIGGPIEISLRTGRSLFIVRRVALLPPGLPPYEEVRDLARLLYAVAMAAQQPSP